MALNNISTMATKELRQTAKLGIAQAKRQGKILSDADAISGVVDDTQPYYNARNTLDETLMPTLYDDNDVVNNANEGGLVEGRPWT